MVARQAGGISAALRRDTDEQGRGLILQRLGQRGQHRSGMLRAEPLGDVATSAGAVENGDDQVAAVLDDAHRGLGAGLTEQTLSQDDVAAASLRVQWWPLPAWSDCNEIRDVACHPTMDAIGVVEPAGAAARGWAGRT